MIKLGVLSLCFLYLIQMVLTLKSDTFTEELFLKPLYAEQIYAHFHFNTKWENDQNSFRHSHLFPRVLGEIIESYNLQELHITLTNGLWRYESWGYPVVDAAPGAEVWAWFKPGTENIDRNWKRLTSSLSGLLCASLNFIDESNSVSPKFSFRPRGVVEDIHVNSSLLRYASLPREIVCTENLTPWKKLLPCDSKKGLASLLNSGYIHNTRYHSIGIHLRPNCRDESCERTVLDLQQTVSLVYDYKILGTRNWSFRRLFGQGIMGACPLAKSSNIYIDTSINDTLPFQLTPAPDEYVTSIRGGQVNKYAKYKVQPYIMSINAEYTERERVVLNSSPALYATQYLTGYGKEKGGVVITIYNNHWSYLDVVVLQNIPWYVPIYLHTLKIESNGKELRPLALEYIPGRQRIKPYYLETLLRLPSKSVTKISVEFDYVFLKWQEYPPDANHGFYIGSAVISSALPLARNFTGLPQDGSTISETFNASRSSYLVQVRTETMVITLPTPDFSMPYNVICLACTVVALAFGPLHNITTKRLVLKSKDDTKLFDKLKAKVKNALKLNKEQK